MNNMFNEFVFYIKMSTKIELKQVDLHLDVIKTPRG
jgi:hypothetical protein